MMIGWFLSAYFLGGYAEDGRGINGLFKAVFTAAKSWAVAVPVCMLVPFTWFPILFLPLHGISKSI